MYRKSYILLLLCVAMLLPSIALAQDFAIFAKQRVVVADVRDRNDRPLSDGIKKVVRQGIIDACANSNDYEVYEVSMDDIRQQLKASGQTPSFPNICKQIGQQADYIIFTEIKTSSSAVGVSANNVALFISSNLYRIATATEVLADTERAEATSQSIIEASTRLVSRMLGITPSSQPRTQTYAQQPTSTSSSTQPTNQQSGNHSQNYSQQPQTRTYKIGDLYEENGKKGVVFAISGDGKHGRIISIQETQCCWDDAKTWCAQLGGGWRLPTSQELLMIYKLKENTQFNDGLFWAESQGMKWVSYYWTGEEYESDFAWGVYMGDGTTHYYYKHCNVYVRAVSAF